MSEKPITDYGLVSIITASYNSSKFIEETLESILNQSYKNWELIITDDCSCDNTCEIIEKYAARDERITLIKLPENNGAGVARDSSIKAANGRFIAFCDSDDRWAPDKLEKQLKFMVDNDYKLTYTSYRTCTEEGEINGYVKCLPKINRRKIIRDNGIGCLTAIYDAGKIGKQYMPSLRKRQDWCLWMDIISKYGAAYGLQEPLAIYRITRGSVSRSKTSLLKYNFDVYHKFLGYNKLTSAIILSCYFMPYYIFKKIKQKLDSKTNM